MKIRKLSELGTFKNGLNFSKEDAAGEGCKMIGVGDFGDRTYPDVASLSEINKELVSETELLADGDILFVRSNGNKALVGRSMYIKSLDEDVCYSGFCIRFRPDQTQVDPTYLFYALRSPYCRKQYTPSQQTNITNLSQDVLGDVLVPVFDEIADEVQCATLLDAIDSKIDLNQQTCATMESMAKTLYDYWFVQFDFPDANGKPYRASGGEMVWNEQLKREIPKGWEIASINGMTTSYRGVSYDKNDLLPSSENGVLVLRGNNIQNNRLVYDRNVAYVPRSFVSKEQQIRAHDIILTMSSGSKEHIGKCTRFQYDSPHTYGAFLTKFTPDTDKVGFVYLSMISDFFKKRIKAICNGTGINNLINETFDNLIFPNPTASVLKQFEKTVAPILEKMGSCEKENETLISLRDWLLPMLMNGQATVAPAESSPKLQVLQPEKPARDPRFDRWLQTQGVAARGTVDEQTLHDIFDAMDDDDKQ